MAKYPLIARVPEIWRRLDANDVSRGLFTAIDGELENIGDATEEYLSFLNVDLVPDKFLPLLADLVGHIWREDRPTLWNRNRIRFAIKRASYKGTTLSIEDLLRENGAVNWRITDQTSRLDIWNRQGGWNCLNGVVMDGNFWHDGAYYLEVDGLLDIEQFQEEFETIKRAGTVWFISRTLTPTTGAFGMQATSQIVSELESCNRDYTGLFWNYTPHCQTQIIEELNE